jgi:hypothetical protein
MTGEESDDGFFLTSEEHDAATGLRTDHGLLVLRLSQAQAQGARLLQKRSKTKDSQDPIDKSRRDEVARLRRYQIRSRAGKHCTLGMLSTYVSPFRLQAQLADAREFLRVAANESTLSRTRRAEYLSGESALDPPCMPVHTTYAIDHNMWQSS